MGDVDLNSLWSYDLDPTYDIGTLEPATADCNACPHCAKKQIKLDTEHSVNADLIQCVAELTRENAAVVKENEALRAKLWSLEHGGGVAQPAPPGRGDSGGGVAATPSASASARALSCSPSTSSSGPSGIENGGPAAASPKVRAHEDAVETRQALKANAAKALATGGEGMLVDRTEAASGGAAAVDPDGVVVDAPGSSGAPERCWKCRGRDRSNAACEVGSVAGLIASETAIANGRGAGAKRAATVLAAGRCSGGEGGLYEGIVCPVLKMPKLASPVKGTRLAETVERAQTATALTASAKFAAAISLYSEARGQSPPAATSAPPAPAATPSSGEMAAARKHAPRPSTAPFSPPLERNSGGGGDSCQQRTRDVPRSTSSENLAGAEGTEAQGRLQGSADKSERRDTAAISASARASSSSPPPHPPSSPPSSSAVHSAMADAGEANNSSAGGFHRASTSSAVDSAAAVKSWGRAATNMKVVKEEPVEATEAPLGGSRGVVTAAASSSRSMPVATVTRRSHRDSEEAGFGATAATAAKGSGDDLCTIRRMHVLQCFLCGCLPAQPRESRIVVFCSTCPRKACLSCHENQVSKDRTNWTQGKDAYGRFFEIPKCRECINDVDDRIPSLEPRTAALLRGSGRDASAEDLRAALRKLLRKLLDWLEDHDLAHFFVHDVDAEEYPDYPKKVKNPMNLSRMRRRLEAGEYDIGLQDFNMASWGEGEGRDTKTAVMEDVEWVLRNCIKFNGELAAISRSAYIFHKRADNYLRAYIDPLVKLLRRRGRQGAVAGHTAPCDGVYNGGGGRDRCGLRYRPVVDGRRDSDGAMNRNAGGSGNGYGEADSRTRRRRELGRQRHHSTPHSAASAAEKFVARACVGPKSKSSSKSPTGRSASPAFRAGAESGDGDRTGDQDEAEEIDGVDEAEWFDVRGTSAKSATANTAAPATATAAAAATTAATDGARRRGGHGYLGSGGAPEQHPVWTWRSKKLSRERKRQKARGVTGIEHRPGELIFTRKWLTLCIWLDYRPDLRDKWKDLARALFGGKRKRKKTSLNAREIHPTLHPSLLSLRTTLKGVEAALLRKIFPFETVFRATGAAICVLCVCV